MQSKTGAAVRNAMQTVGMYANKAKDLLLQDQSITSLETELADLVSEHSRSMYTDGALLQGLLERVGIDNRTVYKICLLTQSDGFSHMIDGEGQLRQTDINVFVVNAQSQTGLNRSEIQRLLRAILLSVGSAIDLDNDNASECLESATIAYVIPDNLYEKEFISIIDDMNASSNRGEKLSHETQSRLEVLAASGIPKAQYLLGTCILSGLIPDSSEELALKLLKEAADACNTAAAASLADYYYNKGTVTMDMNQNTLDEAMAADVNVSDAWSKAFEYYTGFGSAKLTAERKRNVLDIYNHGIFNQRMIACCICLLISMAVFLLFAFGSSVYAPHIVMGILCLTICICTLTLAKILNKMSPYDDVYLFPTLMFVIWALYIGVRLFFY